VHTQAPVRCTNWLRRAARAASLVTALSSFAVSDAAVSPMVADGAWLIEGTGAAVQIFDCSGLLCGRIIGCGRRVISLGGWPLIKRTRIRHSYSACFAA